MLRMAKAQRDSTCKSSLFALCLVVGLSLAQGCARTERLHAADASATATSKQQLPFHPDSGQASASEGTAHAASTDPKLTSNLPFLNASHARVLPSGTLLTVQLEGSLSANRVHAGDAFAASVAAPLVVDGRTLIERGTEVTGRVEAARSRPGSSYVRLALSTITVEGTRLELQTSSLFAGGAVRELQVSSGGTPSTRKSESPGVPKGRRLTFRLTAPVTLNDPSSVDKGQSMGTATE